MKDREKSVDNETGKQLGLWRQQRGKSLADLVRETGYSKEHLSRVENGRATPSIDLIESYGRILEMPVEELIKDQGEGKPAPRRRTHATSSASDVDAAFNFFVTISSFFRKNKENLAAFLSEDSSIQGVLRQISVTKVAIDQSKTLCLEVAKKLSISLDSALLGAPSFSSHEYGELIQQINDRVLRASVNSVAEIKLSRRQEYLSEIVVATEIAQIYNILEIASHDLQELRNFLKSS